MKNLLKNTMILAATIFCFSGITTFNVNAENNVVSPKDLPYNDTDSYSEFYCNRSTTFATSRLTNRSGVARYIQASVTAYLNDGTHGFEGDHFEGCPDGYSSGCTYVLSGATAITYATFRGSMYSGVEPYGDTISSWVVTK